MIVPDLNLLIYAHDASSPHHAKAIAWWEACLSGREPVGLPVVVAMGFVRLVTHPRVFHSPMTPSEAADCVRGWLAQPTVRVLDGEAGHIERTLSLLESAGTAGNLTTDAQIAALAQHHGAVLHSADADFDRFRGLRRINPLAQTPRRSK